TFLIHGGEVALGLAASSYVNSRFAAPGHDHVEFRGIPFDGVLGGAGMLASLLGWFGSMNTHVGMLSLGVFLPAIGRPIADFGMQQRLAREQLSAQVASGQLPAAKEPVQQQAQVRQVPAWAQR
ncbi:MAG: hypothetical protein ACYDH4_10895, partial [Candidatus Cryosericum sp.]